MPIAVNDPNETQKFELKSCPEGYVVLKRLTYGQIVQRRTMMTMSLAMGKKNDKNAEAKGEMALASVEVNNFEYANCVVEHNLEKADGTPLNLKSPVDLQFLDPRIGQEIELHISEMNNFEAAEGE